MKNLLTLLALCTATTFAVAQTTMNIYQSNGSTIILPLSTIDSITFTSPPPSMVVWQTGGGTISVVLAGVDSITYTIVGGSGGITALNCNSATNSGTLTSGTAASGVSSSVPYTGGNGGTHNGQTVSSTGVTGLTAILTAGSFANGSGSLTYAITGTPSGWGGANFELNIGGQMCTLVIWIPIPVGSIDILDCAGANHIGSLTAYEPNGFNQQVVSEVSYAGSNGGNHNGQSVASTGVVGLTAYLTSGTFDNGGGVLLYSIVGTPENSGIASFALDIGGQTCSLSRTVLLPAGNINSLICDSYVASGNLTAGIQASEVSFSIAYTGGNGGTHNGFINLYPSNGIVATVEPGIFAIGTGTLEYTVSGTPENLGPLWFEPAVGGSSCNFESNLNPPHYIVDCYSNHGATEIVEVMNPQTGRIWMDRNLGASQAASNFNDALAYGDLYQWGRGSDGHQCRVSLETNILSPTDEPDNDMFINSGGGYWTVTPNTNLWQGINGVNNPCPVGYRLPTVAEWNSERLTWSSNNATGAFGSPLRLTPSGLRTGDSLNPLFNVGLSGFYWSSSSESFNPFILSFGNNSATTSWDTTGPGYGASVRCIKD